MLNVNGSGRVSITIESSKLASDIRIKQENVDRYVKTCLHKSCELIRDYAKQHHSYKDRTHDLTKAIRYKVISDVKNPYGIVYIDPNIASKDSKYSQPNYDAIHYGQFVSMGTGLWGKSHKTYSIYPRYKKALSFIDRKTKKRVTVRYVKAHPGSKGSRFLENARKNTRLEVKYIWEQELKELINGK